MFDLSQTFITQIGLVLSFGAGFLLAPELLGVARLRWVRMRLHMWRAAFQPRLERWQSIVQHNKNAFLQPWIDQGPATTVVLTVFTGWFLIGMAWLLVGQPWVASFLFVLLGTTMAVFLAIVTIQRIHDHTGTWRTFLKDSSIIVSIPIVAIVLLLLLLYASIYLLLLTGAVLLIQSEAITQRLADDSAFRSVLTALGLACYILGFALQFIATL